MKPVSVMILAGEASGDALAAELVVALRRRLGQAAARGAAEPQEGALEPRFFGAGGPRMAAAGVALAVDLTAHAVFGLAEVMRRLGTFMRLGQELLALAVREQPELIILVDNAGFNRRFAAAVKRVVRAQAGLFHNWRPRIVYFVSPQVWASREGRAYQLARDVDLLLSIFPFEKAWYAQRVPGLRVEFVGHPMVDRFRGHGTAPGPGASGGAVGTGRAGPLVLLLPGSRAQEVRRHLPVMAAAVARLREGRPGLRVWMVLPNEKLLALAGQHAEVQPAGDWGPEALRCAGGTGILCSVGRLADLLTVADLALASSGTVTMECAWFRVPTVVMYKVAWPTYWIARRIVKVPFIAMPNLLAKEVLYPEFIQSEATADRVAKAGATLLENAAERARIQAGLDRVLASLGGPGACARAAEAIASLRQ